MFLGLNNRLGFCFIAVNEIGVNEIHIFYIHFTLNYHKKTILQVLLINGIHCSRKLTLYRCRFFL